MKTTAVSIIILAGLFPARDVQAQGTVYLSNLGQPSIGSLAVGSDSWYAVLFKTGNNGLGYVLNSIQLGMADALGNPTDFSVMIYGNSNPSTISPGSSGLVNLNGFQNPVVSGIFTYTPVSNLTLSPNTLYYIVVTAGTTVANDSFELNLANANSYNASGGWGGITGVWASNNGSDWNSPAAIFPEYAITATPVPEPSPAWLLLAGGGIFFYVRKLRST